MSRKLGIMCVERGGRERETEREGGEREREREREGERGGKIK